MLAHTTDIAIDTELQGPLLEDLALLPECRLETRTDARGKLRYRVAGMAMAWCASVAEAIKVASILYRNARVSIQSPA